MRSRSHLDCAALQTDMLPSTLLKVPLEHLDLTQSQKGCYDWLSRCPNLVKCKLDINEDHDPHQTLPTINLPRLTGLQINANDSLGGTLDDLFPYLVTPVLSHLLIEYSFRWGQSLASLLERSKCSIRQLHLLNFPSHHAELIECLRMLPSLAEIIIQHATPTSPAIPSILLQHLTYRPPKLPSFSLLCPRLQAITLEGFRNVDGEVFGDNASRWNIRAGESDVVDDQTSQVVRLKSVTINLCDGLDVRTKARLMKFKDEGLELNIIEVTRHFDR